MTKPIRRIIDRAKEEAYKTYRFNMSAYGGNPEKALQRAKGVFFMHLAPAKLDEYTKKDEYIAFIESLGY